MKKYPVLSFLVTAVSIAVAVPTLAHVAVKPAQVGVGAFQTFTMGVPNEKEVPTVGIRLVIPAGLNFVTPNVKPGWSISTQQTGEGYETKVTEISWTAGSIPAGQRDEFMFSAQVPVQTTTLQWKAYQTYQNGEVVAWDQPYVHQEPGADGEEVPNSGPYSETKIVNDLAASATPAPAVRSDQKLPITSGLALVISIVALGVALLRK